MSRLTKLSFVAAASVALLGCFTSTDAFYLPGVAPKEYSEGDSVALMVNALTPGSDTELKSVISFDYYDPRLGFCQPTTEKAQAESLGSILFGDRIWNSPYEVKWKESCRQHKWAPSSNGESLIFFSFTLTHNVSYLGSIYFK